eukprot:358718-Chlamydomonas_euryale.AAC.3
MRMQHDGTQADRFRRLWVRLSAFSAHRPGCASCSAGHGGKPMSARHCGQAQERPAPRLALASRRWLPVKPSELRVPPHPGPLSCACRPTQAL